MVSTIRLRFYFFSSTIPEYARQQEQSNSRYVQQQIQQPCKKTLKSAPIILPTIAENASTVFPASHLRASTSLFNRFFKACSSFGEYDSEAAGSPPLPRSLAIASTICLNGNRKSSKCQYYCCTLFMKKYTNSCPQINTFLFFDSMSSLACCSLFKFYVSV